MFWHVENLRLWGGWWANLLSSWCVGSRARWSRAGQWVGRHGVFWHVEMQLRAVWGRAWWGGLGRWGGTTGCCGGSKSSDVVLWGLPACVPGPCEIEMVTDGDVLDWYSCGSGKGGRWPRGKPSRPTKFWDDGWWWDDVQVPLRPETPSQTQVRSTVADDGGLAHSPDQWKQLVHSILRVRWDSLPQDLKGSLEGLLRVEPPTPAAPTREQEQWQVTKDFKQASGKLRDLGQQKLAIESKLAKAKAVLEEQQAQLTKVQQKLAEQQQEVEACSRKYAEKVLQAQLEPEVPELRPDVANAVARAAQAEADKQELELRQVENESKVREILEKLGGQLGEEDKQTLQRILQEDGAALKRRKKDPAEEPTIAVG